MDVRYPTLESNELNLAVSKACVKLNYYIHAPFMMLSGRYELACVTKTLAHNQLVDQVFDFLGVLSEESNQNYTIAQTLSTNGTMVSSLLIGNYSTTVGL